MEASATGTFAPPLVSAPTRKKLPLDPTMEAKRKCSASSPTPCEPPKLRLDTKLSQRRTPHEWSRQAGASTTSARRPSSSTVPETRQATWQLLEEIVPVAPEAPENVLALANDRSPSSVRIRSARQPSPSRTKRSCEP